MLPTTHKTFKPLNHTFLITLLVLLFVMHTQAQIISTVAGNGTIGYSGDGGIATA